MQDYGYSYDDSPARGYHGGGGYSGVGVYGVGGGGYGGGLRGSRWWRELPPHSTAATTPTPRTTPMAPPRDLAPKSPVHPRSTVMHLPPPQVGYPSPPRVDQSRSPCPLSRVVVLRAR
jgi:hypothetical protein